MFTSLFCDTMSSCSAGTHPEPDLRVLTLVIRLSLSPVLPCCGSRSLPCPAAFEVPVADVLRGRGSSSCTAALPVLTATTGLLVPKQMLLSFYAMP